MGIFDSGHSGPLCLGLFLVLGTASGADETKRVVFPHDNKSDLRGVLNVFQTFRTACLSQPVAEGLANRLLPEGYRIVSGAFHMWGSEEGAVPGAMVLSKTGSEESDHAGGFPIIHLKLPTGDAPDGQCRVEWQRDWDYDKGIEKLATGMAAMLDSWTSYYLEAILDTKPDSSFLPAQSYGSYTDWRTPCWDASVCRFKMLTSLDQSRGMKITLTRLRERH
jgi:hypothetical protein